MGETEGQNQPVQPQLGLFDAISIMVGIVIGASIYKTPPDIFNNVPSPAWGIGVWVLGGVLSLIGALCYAELASTYPRMGGDYVYLSRAFGGWCGFLFGWAQLSVILTASIGAMAFVFAENAVVVMTKPAESAVAEASALSPQVQEQLESIQSALALIPPPTDDESRQVRTHWTAGLAIAAVVVLTLMNFLGVVLGKWVQNFLSLVKVVGLGAIIWIGFSAPTPEWDNYTPADPGTYSLGLAMIFVLYAYGGWNDMAFVASELKNKRNIPRALIVGTALITTIYLAVILAYVFALGFDQARLDNHGASPLPTQVLSKELGGFAGKGMAVLVMISALGAINGLIFAGSRVYASLGNDWPLFARLGRWSPRFRAPIWSLLVQGLISIAMILASGTLLKHDVLDTVVAWLGLEPIFWKIYPGGFEILVVGSAPVFWMFFLLTGLALFALRQRDENIERPFSVPLYPLLPLIFCTTCMYMLYSALAYAKSLSILGFIPLAIGLPLYYYSRRKLPAAPVSPPAPPPEKFAPPVEPPAVEKPVLPVESPVLPPVESPAISAPPPEPPPPVEPPPPEQVPAPDDSPFKFT